jgi:cellulose synthase/poly-beta-1,6-N-acetylglucosamine synthase-like glycosyltransferase/peptidoglycan/xylan/chitin deacetylase (PgdA/CDA1 family)/spore germination protein YaaH
MADSSFIFLDPQGRRWPLFRRVALWGGAVLGVAVVLFIAAVWIRPAVRVPAVVRELKGQLKSASTAPVPDLKAENWQRYVAQSHAAQERLAALRSKLAPNPRADRAVRLGFYADWDANSVVSLHAHADQLTHLSPEWLSVTGVGSALVAEPDPELALFCRAHSLKVIPTLRNLAGDLAQPEAVESLARADAARQQAWAQGLASKLGELGAGGVLCDFNGLDPGLQPEFTTLFTTIAEVLHAQRLELWFAVSMDDEFATFDLAALTPVVDHFVALVFDEHSETDEAGPVASQAWLDGWLEVLADLGAPEKWVIALGTQAYDWNHTRDDMESLSFRDAMSRASYAGVDAAGGLALAAPSYNGHFAYDELNGAHEVWFLDAVSLHNQLRAAAARGFGDFALFRLGTEDPAVWPTLARGGADADPPFLAMLSKLPTDQTVTHVGRGEIVSVDLSRDDGTRVIEREPDGKLLARYTDAPTYPALYHQGAADKTKVAITFDDGPDPEWTPRVLDLLKARGLKATFFLLGVNAEDHPALVRRIVAEGHEIGNHTYSHRNMAEMPPWRWRLELDATERLIETITGRSTSLFRPPYDADVTPTDIAQLAPLRFAEHELGYSVVLESIDPQDWARPGADTIVQRVKEQRRSGNIILLHDAGGDRSQTLAALPRILDWLAERGDQVVSLSELLNIPRDDLMPPVRSGEQSGWRVVAASGFRAWHWLVELLWSFMIVATGLVVVRSLLLAWLAWRQRREMESRVVALPQNAPAVSVLIAAYNEGKVIARTLRSLLETDYTGEIEVIVVDDGSSDDTAATALLVADSEPRVRVLQQVNAGKSAALRRALDASRHEVIVFLDADTLFERPTIRRLVEELVDLRVAAVSGNARVGNRVNFVTRCQALEYICGFNLDRRAYTRWNCVTVVPGAISAFRRAAIREAGGFSHDTLAEDTDLTLTLHRLGHRIAYAPAAIAWTEAPQTWRALAKQRVRWAFGTMQCLWKHRDLTFNPRFGALGLFALPSIWFFHILLVAITPLADAILLWSLVAGYAAALGKYFAIFLLLDLALAILACALERVPLRRALLILPMRFAYRWLLAWVVWKSLLRAVRGALVGWGKLERTGTAVAT